MRLNSTADANRRAHASMIADEKNNEFSVYESQIKSSKIFTNPSSNQILLAKKRKGRTAPASLSRSPVKNNTANDELFPSKKKFFENSRLKPLTLPRILTQKTDTNNSSSPRSPYHEEFISQSKRFEDDCCDNDQIHARKSSKSRKESGAAACEPEVCHPCRRGVR